MTVPTRGKAPTFNIYLLYHNITLPKSQPISAAKREAHADGENGTWRFDVPVLKWRKRQKGDEKMELKTQVHNILPLYDEKSRVLILGSFPSVKSREAAFFYAHPQNRFWPTLAAVLGEETPKTVEEKKAMVLRRGVAMWDTIGSCEIVGSSDASITNVVPNDLSVIWMRRTFRPSSATAARPTPAIKNTAARSSGARPSSFPPPRRPTPDGRRKSLSKRGAQR